MTKFTYDDIVKSKNNVDRKYRPGEKAWIVAIIEDRDHFPLHQFPPGVVYSIEFENGDAVDILEDDLEKWEEP